MALSAYFSVSHVNVAVGSNVMFCVRVHVAVAVEQDINTSMAEGVPCRDV